MPSTRLLGGAALSRFSRWRWPLRGTSFAATIRRLPLGASAARLRCQSSDLAAVVARPLRSWSTSTTSSPRSCSASRWRRRCRSDASSRPRSTTPPRRGRARARRSIWPSCRRERASSSRQPTTRTPEHTRMQLNELMREPQTHAQTRQHSLRHSHAARYHN